MPIQVNRVLSVLAGVVGLIISASSEAALYDRGNGLIYDDVLNVTWMQDANLFKSQATINPNLVNEIIQNIGSISDSSIGSGEHVLTLNDFDSDTGRMTWWGAMAWTKSLSYAGYNDWRLPLISDSAANGFSLKDFGYNPDTSQSELAHLYYDALEKNASQSLSGSYQADFGILGTGKDGWNDSGDSGPFNNVQSFLYWTGTEYPSGKQYAWYFATYNGFQYYSRNYSGPDYNYLHATEAHSNPYYLGGSILKDAQYYAWAVHDGDIAAVPLPATIGLFGLGFFSLIGMRKK